MDECETFGSEFCRNGQCLNTVPGYKCFCRTGYFYDAGRLECIGKMTSKSSSATTEWRYSRAVLAGPDLAKKLNCDPPGNGRGGRMRLGRE